MRAWSFGSLAYGIGYAYAQDNVCMFADKLLQVNGERARYFGATAPAHVAVNSSVPTLDSDFFYRSQFDGEALAASYQAAPRYVRDLATGYAAGYNRYLRDTGVDDLPAPCRGAAWVRPITERDLYLWWNSVATQAGNQNFIGAIVNAQPPALASRQTKARPRALAAAGGPLDRPKQRDPVDGPARLIERYTGGILRDIMILIVGASIRAIEQNLPNLSPSLLADTWQQLQTNPVRDFLALLHWQADQ